MALFPPQLFECDAHSQVLCFTLLEKLILYS